MSRITAQNPTTSIAKTKTTKAEIADSWEDALSDSEEETPTLAKTSLNPAVVQDKSKILKVESLLSTQGKEERIFSASGTSVDEIADLLSSHSPFYGNSSKDSGAKFSVPEKRPEKTMSTANRMIGAALGVRIRQTDEQRKAHKALIESEKRKRQQDRERKAEEEKAKKKVWEDD
jgi:hypothetical protein